MSLHDAIRRMHDSNNRLEEHLAEGPRGPQGPEAYDPPPPRGAGFPSEPRLPIRHLTDHEKVLAGLYRLKGRAERDGHTASRAIYIECIRMLGGLMTDPRDTTLPGIGRQR
jgi:hypothetical protein